MSKQVNAVGTMTAIEGKADTVRVILAELVTETRKEPGNIEYFIMEDTVTPNTFFSIEKWENAEAEAKHWEMPHLAATFAKLKGLLDGEGSVKKGSVIS